MEFGEGNLLKWVIVGVAIAISIFKKIGESRAQRPEPEVINPKEEHPLASEEEDEVIFISPSPENPNLGAQFGGRDSSLSTNPAVTDAMECEKGDDDIKKIKFDLRQAVIQSEILKRKFED